MTPRSPDTLDYLLFSNILYHVFTHMPHTVNYDTESAANKAIGGVPVIHYFDFQSRGRGQVVRLLLIVGTMSRKKCKCVN